MFPKTIELTRKDLLWNNIKKMCQEHGDLHFGFAPETFILPNDRDELLANIEDIPKYSEYSWIVKPASV